MKSADARIVICMILLFSACGMLNAQDATERSEFIISDFMLQRLPGGYFYQNFFENLAPDATSLIEESNGFAQLDFPKVYFEGDSFTQFNWYFNGFSINSALDDGAPAFQLPLLAIGSMALLSETPRQRQYGFHFNLPAPSVSRSRLMASTVFSNMGGYTSLGKLAIGNHASLRADNLYSSRRQISGNQALDYAWEAKSPQAAFLLALGYFNLERRFNDFNVRNTQFAENSSLLQLLSRWQRITARGTLGFFLAANSHQRDRLFAEDGRYPQETYILNKQALFAGLDWLGRPFNLKLSWQSEWERRAPVAMDAGKDLQDIDGQGLFPFEKWGKFQANTVALTFDQKYDFTWLGKKIEVKPYLDLTAVFLGAAEPGGASNALYFAAQPYQVIEWHGGTVYHNQKFQSSGGTLLTVHLLEKVELNARLFFQYQGFSFESARNNCDFFQPGGELGLAWSAGKKTLLTLSYGILPYELRANFSDFLEDQRPGATVYYWQDTNGDGFYQEKEKGPVYGEIGGASHSLSPALRPPQRERILLQFSTPLSANFKLHVKGLYKKIHRPLWTFFADTYGHFEEISGQDYYFIDRAFNGFELGNAAFNKDPFYAQLLLRVAGQKPGRWFFSFSFLAHLGMGYTAFGNGPTANDIGIISESQAFPNSWINGYGRVDGDRAFVGKLFFGYYLSRRLFFSASIKYRDGNPFAFFNAFKKNDQWIITYQTIQAEDEHGVKGGPREDCIWDFNFKLSYEFILFNKKGRLELSLFNLLDFGLELSENVFSDESRRLANELQLPRSLRLGVEFEI
ncbi:MAG: hypothetical protein JXI33_08485 [Candidatus Aminicenantes bacterium]|nr:hypothetical protein [Candidatus Aminicenantes bacterium]